MIFLSMGNTIFSNQNKKENQILIVTQHFVYRSAKKLAIILFIISVIFPISFNIFLIFFNTTTIATIFSFFSILFLIVSEVVRNLLSNKKNIAAQIQQKFDIKVYELKNDFYINEESIGLEIEKYKYKDWNRKKNWYNDYKKLDKNEAIFYCQKENIDWTNNLSKKYVTFLKICFSIMLILSIISFIIINDSISHVISVFVICLPLFTYCYSGSFKIKNDNIALKEINDYASKIELDIKNGIDEKKLENLQWMLFYYRKNKYLIPDWFDKIFYKEIKTHELNKSKNRKKKK